MNTTNKQIIANRKNAQKSTGPTTESGKAIAAHNSLKHGLLAKEVVIDAGDGAESQAQFDSLLADLKEYFAPQGTLEEMLVEKIAVAYWRLRRAHRFEVGLIRDRLDNLTDNFYTEKTYDHNDKNKTDEEIDRQTEQEKEGIQDWQKDRKELSKMHKAGKPLDEIIGWDDNWRLLYHKLSYLVPENALDDDDRWTQQMREYLNNKHNWTDDQIWQAHIDLCDDRIEYHKQQISDLNAEKEKNRLKLQVKKKLGSIPEDPELNRLLKYEGSIERQFYKAIDQLERLQRRRLGDNVPAPINIDLTVDKKDGIA